MQLETKILEGCLSKGMTICDGYDQRIAVKFNLRVNAKRSYTHPLFLKCFQVYNRIRQPGSNAASSPWAS
jgi:hypothetical protein